MLGLYRQSPCNSSRSWHNSWSTIDCIANTSWRMVPKKHRSSSTFQRRLTTARRLPRRYLPIVQVVSRLLSELVIVAVSVVYDRGRHSVAFFFDHMCRNSVNNIVINTTVSHCKMVTSQAAMVTDYRGRRRTLLFVWEINIKSCISLDANYSAHPQELITCWSTSCTIFSHRDRPECAAAAATRWLSSLNTTDIPVSYQRHQLRARHTHSLQSASTAAASIRSRWLVICLVVSWSFIIVHIAESWPKNCVYQLISHCITWQLGFSKIGRFCSSF